MLSEATLAYGAQQVANGAILGSFYALLAVAFTLIYGLTNRIVLAFGDFAMFAAYSAVLAAVFLMVATRANLVVLLLPILILTLLVSLALGRASQEAVFSPLLDRPSQAILIASIGLSIVLREAVRMASGGREQWLPPVLNQPLLRWEGSGYLFQVTRMQGLVCALSLTLAVLLIVFMRYSRFGRAWRACAENPALAALCGIDIRATTARTFLLAAAAAAVTGASLALYYGGVSFYMGTVLGLKALFAAIIGGIGSLGGALLGGFLLAALETGWSASFALEYRDVAVFAAFILLLIFRPGGLIGTPYDQDRRIP